MADPIRFEAMQFVTLEDYLSIVEWMKESGDTWALADEVTFSTPIMVIHTPAGSIAANPGDWVARDESGRFTVLGGRVTG